MDKDNFNKNNWDPLNAFVKPGNTVIIKPNLVNNFNPIGKMDELITHGSVIRAMIDYVYIALKNKGTIIIADSPVQKASFSKLTDMTGLDDIVNFYNDNTDINIKVIDFRTECCNVSKSGMITKKFLNGDPLGYTSIDLKDDSELSDVTTNSDKFRITNYDCKEMQTYHNKLKHEYLVPNSLLLSDTIINIPKLKTHKKAGMTCSLKNMVGINGHKNFLPHHSKGSLDEGGDEYRYKSYRKKLIRLINEKMDKIEDIYIFNILKCTSKIINFSKFIIPYKDVYFEGNWYGNDTIPRVIVDLNKIAIFADKMGILRNNAQRSMFTLVDAIVAGEGDGPLTPIPKRCGILIAGDNPVATDYICTKIMGYDYKKIPYFKYAINSKKYKIIQGNINDVEVISNLPHGIPVDKFIPPKSWKNVIELM